MEKLWVNLLAIVAVSHFKSRQRLSDSSARWNVAMNFHREGSNQRILRSPAFAANMVGQAAAVKENDFKCKY